MLHEQNNEEGRTMKILKNIHRAVPAACALLAILATTACGGGVATEPAAPASPAPAPAQKAVITLSTSGIIPVGTAIGGVGVTVNLPGTVTVKTSGGGNVDSGVVTTSGVSAGQATLLALYSDATATTPAKLYIVLASDASGMPVGEFATITCDINPGANPVRTDFSLTDFSAVDTSGASIPSLTAALSETVR